MENIRKKGVECLKLVLDKTKNINIFEKNIYKLSKKEPEKYINIIYEVCYDIGQRKPLKKILLNIRNGNILFNHPNFSSIKNSLEEENDFITKPFEIEEGVLQCNKCDSKKTFSYTLQTRSGDESTTVFACCAQCGAKWKT